MTHLSEANCSRHTEGMSKTVYCDHQIKELEESIERIGAGNIAAFITELIMGGSGVLMILQGYHAPIQTVCCANGIPAIADEVTTEFGHLGHFLVSEADINNCAKGLSSG